MSPLASGRSLLRSAGRASALGLLAAGLSGSPAACGTEAVEGGAVCTYGQVVPCWTDAGCQGSAECLPDLSGYGACACGDGGAPPDRDASASAPPDGGR